MKPLDPLSLEQIERRLVPLAAMSGLSAVHPSWISYIRRALCLTYAGLGKLTGLGASSLKEIENREREGRVTLQTMKKIAHAIDCDFIYAIVPKNGGSVRHLLMSKARLKAARILDEADVHMVLEDQAVQEGREIRIASLARSLYEKGDVW